MLQVEVGRVARSTYYAHARAMGGWPTWILLLFLLVVSQVGVEASPICRAKFAHLQGLSILPTFWLAEWSSKTGIDELTGQPKQVDHDYYISGSRFTLVLPLRLAADRWCGLCGVCAGYAIISGICSVSLLVRYAAALLSDGGPAQASLVLAAG